MINKSYQISSPSSKGGTESVSFCDRNYRAIVERLTEEEWTRLASGLVDAAILADEEGVA